MLHTYTENDLAYYREAMGRIVAASHDAGLEVQVAPWGVCQMFGGEAESRFTAFNPDAGQVLDDGRATPAGCPNNPAVRGFVRSWADAAVDTGADRVFWDEPHWVHPEHFGLDPARWGCRCRHCQARWAERNGGAPMPAELTPRCSPSARTAWSTSSPTWSPIATPRGPPPPSACCPWSGVSTACPTGRRWPPCPGWARWPPTPTGRPSASPPEPFVTRFSELVARLAADHGVGAQIWVQGFRMEPSDEPDIRAAVAAARAAGVEDLWTWGSRPAGT